MTFAAPGLLVLLALAPAAAAALAAHRVWQHRAAARFAGAGPLERTVKLPSTGRWLLRAALVVAATALVALAAARPQLGSSEAPLEQAGIDLMIVLDASRSMEARDVAPTRLARAQDEVLALLGRLHGDRVGLVTFAQSAVLRSPLTTDLNAVAQQVRGATQDQALLQPGTSLGGAIDLAAEALTSEVTATGGRTASRAIVVVSDGEDHEGEAVAAVRRAAEAGLRVYTAGAGSQAGASIPSATAGESESGEVTTRLNEPLLRQLAIEGSGRYVHLTGDGRPLASFADDFAALERTVFVTTRDRLPIERFQWFAGAALVALALERALAHWGGVRRSRWGVAAGGLAAVALLATSCGDSLHDRVERANDSFAAGAYEEALDGYQRAQAERPDLPELSYNVATTLHRLDDFERAAQEARRGLATAEGAVAARLYYGLGNHLFRSGDLEGALLAYKRALIEAPDDADAKYNLEVVQRLLEMRAEASGEGPPSGRPSPADDAAGADESTAGGPPPDDASRPSEDPAEAARIQRDLQEALAGIESDFTIEEALRVLDLLREQQIQQEPLGPAPAGTGEPDY